MASIYTSGQQLMNVPGNVEELNQKLVPHLIWSNNKPMRTLGDKTPQELLAEKLKP